MLLDRLRSTLRLVGAIPRLRSHGPDDPLTAADRLERRAAEHPERTFVVHGDRRLSYAAVDAEANRVAHWARSRGVGRGDVVALLMENRPEYVSTWLGVAKLGAVTALLNTNLTGRALDHALRAAGGRQLVVGGECLDRFATASRELAQGLEVWTAPDPEAGPEAAPVPAGSKDLAAALADAPCDPPGRALRAGLRAGDDLFYIYTSGTTGPPKAARFSHMRFLAGGDLFAWAAQTGPEDVEYVVLPLYHTAGGVVALSRALAAGASIALERRFSASRFWDGARRYRATSFQYIGELCRYLLAQPPRPEDREHDVRIAIGNGLRPDIWERFQNRFGIERIVEFYGATEGNTGLINLEGRVGAVGRLPFKWLSNARLIRYDLETDSHPRDRRGRCIECMPGEVGELIGRIPRTRRAAQGRFEGYTSAEESERKLLRDVFRAGDAWFRSGDLLRCDRDGYYYFVDRIGDTFRWKGENVSTQEVAEILSGFPGIDMVSVYGVRIPGAEGRAGMAAFVLQEGARFEGGAFYRFARGALPAYALPAFVRLLPEAPVTGTLKLRKVELQRDGYDLERVCDPLFVRDDEAASYAPLDPERLARLRSGTGRL